jgi:hypothetical protein
LRIFRRKPLSVNRFFSSLIICVNLRNLRTNELALPLLERLLSVPDQVNQPNCGITLSGSSPALAVTRTSGRFSGPEIDWQRCALNGGNLPPASVKQFKLRRVSQGNFLPEFRIALLLAAAPNERAKWQPSPAQDFIFLLAIFGPIVHSRKVLQGVRQEKLVRCP